MEDVGNVLGLLLAAIIVVFHTCSLIISGTSKELTKSRFLQLALFLSLSDCALGLEIIYFHVLQYLKNGGDAYLLQCMAITNIIGGTILSSLLQTLLICLERLHATYPIKLKILEALTGNKAVGICFASCHCFGLVRFGITTIGGPVPCDDKYTINPIMLFSNDLIVIILIITISVCYIVVIMRLLKQQKSIGLMLTGVSENQRSRANTSSLRMRKNALTLGMIIILTVIATLPRTITGMYSYAVGGSEKAISVMWLTNNIMLVNPLVDPFIYIFRIKRCRDRLTCKRCGKTNDDIETTI